MKFSFELEQRIIQFVKFNIIGLCNTAVDFSVFVAATWLGLPAVGAQLIAYGAGMLNSYYWNGRWTFGSIQSSQPALIFRFLMLNGFLLGFSTIAVMLLAKLVPVLAAKIAVICTTVVLNYLGSRSWIYRLNKES
ncbi:GtrA family protein [Paenibacillus radicis (ex Xue et al. 2023)]|uniref:GtrA family protein n=1 Tax=Paenibacillus radicis (ex Xue et al. 2023) TaxID=2972489 RepID=A0ABT1YIL3_9BACL|nr:GtrA family protein [Paenibacillus radicis (ex Xue et al. 2023)]MCR8633023.1 GtrA family protein [Paenibacillus radicis (ex Xue et al. 2023)]